MYRKDQRDKSPSHRVQDSTKGLRIYCARYATTVLLWGGLLGFAAHQAWPQAAAALGIGTLGLQAPSFSVTTLEDKPISMEKLRGKVVLVNFWTTWCGPCRSEMPGFEQVYQDMRDRDFVILGLSTDKEGRGVVQHFVTEQGITFPVAMATEEIIQDFGNIQTLPTSFLIDRAGRIRHTVTGRFASTALRLAAERLLKEASQQPVKHASAVQKETHHSELPLRHLTLAPIWWLAI